MMYAQQIRTIRGIVKGIEAEDKEKEPLPFSSVIILDVKDSTLVKSAVSDKEGNFVIQYHAKKGKKYLLKASYLGFNPTFRLLPDTVSTFRLGTILLDNVGILMNEVVVTGKLPEVTLKGDTTLINADAFKTPEGSSVKDLVKRVPGLDYDEENHTLTYNGKPIQEINVNGEPFFLDNIQVAMEKLPAKFVSKLKVYNKQTKKEEATGIKEGKENYVLDLQTKKEMNNTILASAEIGAGNNRKKDLDANLNYFKKGGENLSFYGRSTNRNMNSNYKDNIQNSTGLNFMRRFGKNISLNGGMTYNMGRSGNISSNYTEQYLKSGTQYSNSENEGNNTNKTMNANLNMQWKMSKRTELHLSGGYSNNRSENANINQSATFSASPGLSLSDPFENFDKVPDSIRINRIQNSGTSTYRSSNYNLSANFTYKLNDKGTNLNVSLHNSNANGKSESISESSTTYFRIKNKLGNDSILYRNQLRNSPSENHSWGAGFAFTQPISKNFRAQFSYNWRVRNESDSRGTYDLSTQSEQLIDSLSNRSNGRTHENQIGFLVNYTDTIWTIYATVSAAPQQREINRKIGFQYADTTMHSVNWMSYINAGWKRKKSRINLGYNVNTSQPSLSLLMPMTDNSNPLNITRGNPDLKVAVYHNVRLNYDHSSGVASANLGFSTTQNSVNQVTTYNEQTGGRVTWPVNINGNWSTNGTLRGMKKWGKFRVSIEGGGNYRNNVGLISEDLSQTPERSTTRNTSLQGKVRVSYVPKWGGLNFSTDYYFNHSLNTLRDNNSYTRNYNFRFDGYVDIPGGVQFRTNLGYVLRNGTNIQNSDADEINWNASAIWRFLKEKKAEIGLYWSDILGQAKSYGRMATADGFYEYQSQQTRGYILASFKYNFRIMK